MGGKKRLRDGQVKVTGSTTQRSSNFKDVIKDLGGDEADLSLIDGALSGSEIEDHGEPSAKRNGKFEQDLSLMVKELGFQGPAKATKDVPQLAEPQSKQKPTLEPAKAAPKVLKPTAASTAATTNSKHGARSKKKVANNLLVEPTADWHAVTLPGLPQTSTKKTLNISLVQALHDHAKFLLDKENGRFRDAADNAGNTSQFYSTIVSSGTLSDKVSALTLSVQESPLHHIYAFESLLNLAKKRSRSQAVEVLGALKDLFASGSLLPLDRKLRTFASQPGLLAALSGFNGKDWTAGQPLPKPLKDVHLIAWAFEDWLKAKYFEVISIIETWSHDEITFARIKSVDYVFQLLKERPEQEDNLLRLLVNKLGDPEKKIASRASYNILQLQNTHPAMKHVIVSAIENDLLFRPRQGLHAQYYASVTLNQTVLSSAETAVTNKLLDIYFSLFKQLLAKSEAPEPKPIVINKKGDIQGGGSAPGKAALKKAKAHEKKARVNEELREKMLSAILTGVNRAVPYTNTNDNFFEAHIDTLFRVTHSSNFNTAIQALILIQQIQGNNQKIVDRFYRTLYESLLDPRLLTSSKQTLYLNLLFRAMKNDLNLKRVKAFVKRLTQIIATHQPPFACATLYLIRELEDTFASLRAFPDEIEEDESDGEEHFYDVHESAEHGNNAFGDYNNDRMALRKGHQGRYDGRKRDPEFSGADGSGLWELSPLLTHFHPSVALFASRLMTHESMPPKPDLAQNTLMHFLDRFVYRNPKQQSATTRRGPSIMQPIGSIKLDHITIARQTGLQPPVNSESYTDLSDDKIKPDEVFFHKYFSATSKGRKMKEKKVKKPKDTQGSDDGDGNEDEIWKALVNSKPELDEAEDSDMSLGIDDPDSELGSDDGQFDLDLDNDDGDVEINDALGLGNDDDDDDALVDSDSEVEASSDSEEARNTPLGRVEKGDKKKRRKKLKSLPTFASADDYAVMLE